MKYEILCDDSNLGLIERLLKVRGISDNIESFLDPKCKDYLNNPFDLNDMEKAVNRIISAMKNKEKIMIFGDYDADGVTSSFVLFKFFSTFLNYKNTSIMYPDRIEDGYGLKNKHIDIMDKKGVNLIITVDNGITSIDEVEYGKKLGIDIIITDHHKNLENLPKAVAVVNPIVSPKYGCPYLAGVGVAFKLVCALLEKANGFDEKQKNKIFNYFLPIVAIGTVADIVPLLGENRLFVRKGLNLINNHRKLIPESLKGFLDYLNLKEIDSFHIGFVIGPRINAGGRIASPYESLNILLHTGEKQLQALKNIDEINNERKKMQEESFKIAEESLNLEQKILIAQDESFHEGIVGIVSGKITEKYNKPSVVFKIDKEKGLAIASLRGPAYFDIIDMMQKNSELLERFGGHRGAGGLTVKLENLEEFKSILQAYCMEKISDDDLEKTIYIDSKFYEDEWDLDLIKKIANLGPFGEGNNEPIFLFEKIKVEKVQKVGKNGNGHLKIYGLMGNKSINFIFWGKGDKIESIEKETEIDILGKIKKDDFNGGYSVIGIEVL